MNTMAVWSHKGGSDVIAQLGVSLQGKLMRFSQSHQTKSSVLLHILPNKYVFKIRYYFINLRREIRPVTVESTGQ